MHLPFSPFSSSWLRFGAFASLGGLAILALTQPWRKAPAFAPPLSPLPQDPAIQVFFNHAQSIAYTEPYRQQQRLGDDLEQVMIDSIASAQVSIDVAVQELNLPRVAAALRERQQAGVKVRVILENQYSRPLSQLTTQEISQLDDRAQKKYQDFVQWIDQNQDGKITPDEIAQGDALVILKNAKIPVIDDTADGSKGSGLMHHKFMVIDRKIVMTGSANFTMSDIHGDMTNITSLGNANHLLRIADSNVAEQFTNEFNIMWGDGADRRPDSRFGLQKPFRPARTIRLTPQSAITVYFSPTSKRLNWQQSGNGLIGRTLNKAQDSIDLALFVFSEQPLSTILQQRYQQGVSIRGLIEPQFFRRYYSEALDMMGVTLPDDRCRIEPDNAPWTRPIQTIGTPTLAQGDLLHHKMAIVDGRTVITGSQNWSSAANHENDETILLIHNSIVAAHFHREFERLYQNANLGISPALQQEMDEQRSKCGEAQ